MRLPSNQAFRRFGSGFPVLLLAGIAWAHKGHHHDGKGEQGNVSAVATIREDYARRIEPIFERSCNNCHSDHTRYPSYYKIPGIRQYIDSDIREARSHLDFSGGYPFRSHESRIDDLDEIAETIEKNSMPPFLYRLIHGDSRLTEDEKKTILDWVKRSKSLLMNTKGAS